MNLFVNIPIHFINYSICIVYKIFFLDNSSLYMLLSTWWRQGTSRNKIFCRLPEETCGNCLLVKWWRQTRVTGRRVTHVWFTLCRSGNPSGSLLQTVNNDVNVDPRHFLAWCQPFMFVPWCRFSRFSSVRLWLRDDDVGNVPLLPIYSFSCRLYKYSSARCIYIKRARVWGCDWVSMLTCLHACVYIKYHVHM